MLLEPLVGPQPRVQAMRGRFGCAMTVDVEEWYHTCLAPRYVRPERRPELNEELDRLLPELLLRFDEAGRRGTFFVLGEVAERLPGRVREIAAAGHEVASHGYLHLRAADRTPAAFRRDLERSRSLLEDLVGGPIWGFRAPEWSLRRLSNQRLPLVEAAGYLYDSSLAPNLVSGSFDNPRFASLLTWGNGARLLEFPPLTYGGVFRLPAGSWTGRLANPERLLKAVREHGAKGGLPVAVVHPWEVSGRPTPGRLTGLAWFVHETGRDGFDGRFRQLLAACDWGSIQTAARLDVGAWRTGAQPAFPGGFRIAG
ncbi:MAG TPA: polysaccharide deacetylase family protein [Thermoanaerobaculia bacterium]|nr:polysaccharide deacetylase family protein [Thermoanaerobaculia bacterium]